MPIHTADISDADPQGSRVCDVDFRDYGGRRIFSGPCITLKTGADHRQAFALLNTPGAGRVLVIDGAGPTAHALLGATMSANAARLGWAGVIAFGCIRDSDELAHLDIGIKALGTVVRKAPAEVPGTLNVPVQIGSAVFMPGDWVYADSDGIIVRSSPFEPPSRKLEEHAS
ncbi:ribonuclease E activity regulator RraA [Bordetella genomosp. 13]|uniref:ribonuclease E activity regulator RraA n=1 Tax=Bordetella genomosp. 13 TaxID=463040 RepID=UPI0011A4EC0B|nr:ribonuclease E activity regulator RraA [Bordetella genomosp. 13]